MEILTVSDELYDKLINRILNKEWNLGDKFPSEKQLCEEYGFSRVSVRSALQKLRTQDLIITRPGKGSFIIATELENNKNHSSFTKLKFSKNEYRYFVEFRRAIEFNCIDLICKRGTSKDFENIKHGLELMLNNEVDSDEFSRGDLIFHTSIIYGSHNPMFISIVNSCKDEYVKYMKEANSKHINKHEQILDNHERIYEALLARDAKKARNIIESTVEYNLRKYKDLFSDELS